MVCAPWPEVLPSPLPSSPLSLVFSLSRMYVCVLRNTHIHTRARKTHPRHARTGGPRSGRLSDSTHTHACAHTHTHTQAVQWRAMRTVDDPDAFLTLMAEAEAPPPPRSRA